METWGGNRGALLHNLGTFRAPETAGNQGGFSHRNKETAEVHKEVHGGFHKWGYPKMVD